MVYLIRHHSGILTYSYNVVFDRRAYTSSGTCTISHRYTDVSAFIHLATALKSYISRNPYTNQRILLSASFLSVYLCAYVCFKVTYKNALAQVYDCTKYY